MLRPLAEIVQPYSCRGQLRPETHPAIARAMLRVRPQLPGAAVLVPPLLDVKRPKRCDTSLVRQLAQLLSPQLGLQASSDVKPPTVYLCTERSALPVATALRSFFEYYDTTNGLAAAAPTIASVKAHRALAQGYVAANRRLRPCDRAEIERLAPFVGGTHTALVEQMVSTGRTAVYGTMLAYAAGAAQVSVVRGKWYDNVAPDDAYLHPTAPTDNTAFMHAVGQRAYQMYSAGGGAALAAGAQN